MGAKGIFFKLKWSDCNNESKKRKVTENAEKGQETRTGQNKSEGVKYAKTKTRMIFDCNMLEDAII